MVVPLEVNLLGHPLSPLVCVLKHNLFDNDPFFQVTSVNAAEEAGPSRYQGQLQGVLQCPQGCQGSTHHVQPEAALTQLPGRNRNGLKLCIVFLMKFLVEYHLLNWSMRKYRHHYSYDN